MKIEDVRSGVLLKLQEATPTKGFKLRKADCCFVRKVGDVTHQLGINVQSWTGYFSVYSQIYIGSPKVISFFNTILDRKLSAGEPVCGFAVRNRHRERGTYLVESLQDIEKAAVLVSRDFEEIGLPLLSRIDGYHAIDKYLNEPDSDGVYRPETVDQGCLALIAAKLSGNPQFSTLVDAYYEFLVAAQGEKLASPILKVRDYFGGKGSWVLQLPG